MPEPMRDASGESFADHCGNAGWMLLTAVICQQDGDTQEALEQLAAARQRLDAAERMLKDQPNPTETHHG